MPINSDDSAEWYFTHSEKTWGPVSLERLTQLVQHEKISPDSLIWREGFADWMPFSQISSMPVRGGPPSLPQVSSSANDELILDREDIRITRSVAQFGDTTYAINSLGSIRIDPPRSRTWQKILAAILICVATYLGLGLGMQIYEGNPLDAVIGLFVLGLFVVGFGIWSTAASGPYSLVFHTSGGDVEAYESFDRRDIMEVKGAIESVLDMRAAAASQFE